MRLDIEIKDMWNFLIIAYSCVTTYNASVLIRIHFHFSFFLSLELRGQIAEIGSALKYRFSIVYCLFMQFSLLLKCSANLSDSWTRLALQTCILGAGGEKH